MLGDFRRNILQDDPDIHWPAADIPDVDIPTAFDWRDHNAVTPVKNQVNIVKLAGRFLDSRGFLSYLFLDLISIVAFLTHKKNTREPL